MTQDVENNEGIKRLFYIFLDVDGVLNNENYIIKCYELNRHHPMSMHHVPFDPKSLKTLMLICHYIEDLGMTPKIILSSSWRLNNIDTEIVDARLAQYGLHITDRTPYIDSQRGAEIQDWLEQHESCVDYIILDDELFDICGELRNHLIKTNYKTGLNNRHLNKFKLYLSNKK